MEGYETEMEKTTELSSLSPAPPDTSFWQDRQNVLILSAVLLISFVVYIPSLQNGFVNYDDQVYIYENPHIVSIYVTAFVLEKLINHKDVVDIYGSDEQIYASINRQVKKILPY